MYPPQNARLINATAMSDVFFILGRVAIYLTTPDTPRRVLLTSIEVRVKVFAHAEVVMLKSAPDAAITMVCARRQLATLEL